jgi:mono/diheme cytochrome c family protein
MNSPDQPKSRLPQLLVTGLLGALVIAAALSFVLRGKKDSTGNTGQITPDVLADLKIRPVAPDGASSWSAVEVPPAPAELSLERGRDLFAQACAACHGAGGKGDGPAAEKLSTAASNLADPLRSIKIRSTLSGSPPLASDLYRTLTRGLPGTAMWSYRELPPADRWALVAYVRSLSPDYEKEAKPVVLPAKLPRDAGMLEIGAGLFNKNCHTCHGTDGMGGFSELRDANTRKPLPGLKFAREGGQAMLGGNSEEDIARTLLTGFHQSSLMRSYEAFFYAEKDLAADEKAAADRRFWGVVYHTHSLLEAAAKKK